jgi:hypothetical protein
MTQQKSPIPTNLCVLCVLPCGSRCCVYGCTPGDATCYNFRGFPQSLLYAGERVHRTDSLLTRLCGAIAFILFEKTFWRHTNNKPPNVGVHQGVWGIHSSDKGVNPVISLVLPQSSLQKPYSHHWQ